VHELINFVHKLISGQWVSEPDFPMGSAYVIEDKGLINRIHIEQTTYPGR
jgi:hypothetical protein